MTSTHPFSNGIVRVMDSGHVNVGGTLSVQGKRKIEKKKVKIQDKFKGVASHYPQASKHHL